MPDTVRMSVTVDKVPGPDFTTYEEFKDSASEQNEQTGGQGQESQTPPEPGNTQPGSKKKNFSHEGSVEVNEDGNEPKHGRGLKCRAYGGNYWSITIRCDADNVRQQGDDYSQRLEKGLLEYAQKYPKKVKPQHYLGYFPRGHKTYSKLFSKLPPPPTKPPEPSTPPEPSPTTEPSTSVPDKEIFLNEIYQLCSELYGILLSDRTVTPTGLITLTGATNSSKSLIARGLIFLYLEAIAEEALKNKLRKPHLVTFENPIEQYYIKNPGAQDAPPAPIKDLEKLLDALNIDYTPREKDKDADKLAKVIEDAKRQTPAVFFVGETRDPRDWKDLLDFGGSGHLVITTSHAGSVVEAMTQIFRQTKTENPSQRSQIARRILGIVNIRSFNPIATTETGKTTSNVRALLPAVWKNTSQSVNNLVADGLSSILPALDREPEIGYYGRTYFARRLIHKDRCTDEFKNCDGYDALAGEIERQAMEWDIGGF